MFKIKVIPVDGSPEYALRATSRDVAMWERTGRDRSMGDLLTHLPALDLYRVARFAAIREGIIDRTVKEADWMDLVDIVPDMAVESADEDQDDEGAPDPTEG